MRRRSLLWLLVSICFFLAAAYFWRLGDQWEAQRKGTPAATSTNKHSAATKPAALAAKAPVQFPLLSVQGNLNAQPQDPPKKKADPNARFAYRLKNTDLTVTELTRKETGLLLENALLDSAQKIALDIPEHLQAKGDPGTYIVQAKGPIDESFRQAIRDVGAKVVPHGYIPNNAYIVRATASAAQQMARFAQTVLPYEPYFKLKSGLLDAAVENQPLPDNAGLNLLVFPDAKDQTIAALAQAGVEVLSEEKSPFGPILKVKPAKTELSAIAQLSGVQLVEMTHQKVRANDLSRPRIGITPDSQSATNYLGLSGSGVLVNVNDTGVVTDHPGLPNITGDLPVSLTDKDGHGTFIAGIIAGNGAHSADVTFASGSPIPYVDGQFRGMATNAKIFSMSIDASFGISGSETSFGPFGSDAYLQETAANTNAIISNNSWHYYQDTDYDLAAASYDAAVRDALPGVPGSQPITYVFAAGNSGNGNDDGGAGDFGSIESPGTAKNVITVGAIEQARNITNKISIFRRILTDSNTIVTVPDTNSQPWLGITDSSNQVASFSSRGNVGVNVEGDFGRFKPDLVAPGTFVVSTRSTQWDTNAYYNPTNYHYNFYDPQTVQSGKTNYYSLFVPYNAVGVIIRAFGTVDLPILYRQDAQPNPTTFDFRGTNIVSLPENFPLPPASQDVHYGIVNPTNFNVPYLLYTEIITTNDLGNYLEVLANMNNQLSQWYRYESGTSMSAADVSGMLALMQEYFNTQHITNSPALNKALLINGARSVASRYTFRPQGRLNIQGWGLPNIQRSIPTNLVPTSAGSSMLFFDQAATNALATGDRRTFNVHVDDTASDEPLRVTLVWSDPPGNPAASTKLVNDLDLYVTNLTTGDIFVGNDMGSGSDFTLFWDTNNPPNLDTVNNVENVFLSSELGGAGDYAISVVAKRVNVNAVTAHTNNTVQDFALVISSGDGAVESALTLSNAVPFSAVQPNVTYISNSFVGDDQNSGGFVQNQHVGGNAPLLNTENVLDYTIGTNNFQIGIGMTNQWHFYAITNEHGFTNAAFLTFIPPTLSVPRIGARQVEQTNATRQESDIDLYVSTDSTLTNLNPAAINNAFKSVSRRGTETVVISNAQQVVYYVGVKSESQEAAEYSFLGEFSLLPFGSGDNNGDQTLRGFPQNAPIPDGTPDSPGGTYIFAICPTPLTVKRMVVTNTISHQQMPDLFGRLNHSEASRSVVLNNHSGPSISTNQTFIYNDSSKSITGSQHTDGPGQTLETFNGREGAGQWRLTEVDNAPGNVGSNVNFTVFLEKQQDLEQGIDIVLKPGECDDEFFFVPLDATNVTITAQLTAGTGPIPITVCPLDNGGDCTRVTLGGGNPTARQIILDKSSNPPLQINSLYGIRLCNDGLDQATIHLRVQTFRDALGVVRVPHGSGNPTVIQDDAVTTSTLPNPDDKKIAAIEVGVRIEHPRISDLVLHLISPDGTRMLLAENRGGISTNGMGASTFATNVVPVSSTGGAEASTNIFDTGVTAGSITISYQFYQVPDQMRVYYGTTLIWDSGYVNGGGITNISYGPTNGQSTTFITITMNEGNNPQVTLWDYTISSTAADYNYFTFTEDTNRTTIPIKFAIPPLVAASYANTITALSGFETPTPASYPAPSPLEGWTVTTTNSVTVINDPAGAAAPGVQYLDLGGAGITRDLPTTVGHAYRMTFASKGPTNCFNYTNFASINGLVTLGIAAPAGTAIRVNPNVPSDGSVWRTSKHQVASGFDTTFQFNFNNQVNGGGDGMTFSIQNTDITTQRFLGNNPGGNAGIPFVSVFFNTFYNWPGCTNNFCDLSDNSMGIVVGTATNQDAYIAQVNLNGTGVFLKDGQTHTARVVYDGSLMHVYLDGVPRIVNIPLSLTPVVDSCGKAYIGFTSFSGAAQENHDLLSWSFCSSAQGPGQAIVSTSDGLTNTFTAAAGGWLTNAISFIAQNTTTTVSMTGSNCNPGFFIDNVVLQEAPATNSIYYLPEDPDGIRLANGMNSRGDWKLEVWDNRVGPVADTNHLPTLVSWAVSFVYQNLVPVPVPATHHEPISGTVSPGQIAYITVNVPPWASQATNILNVSGPSILLFNQNNFPGTNVSDFPLITGSGFATLDIGGGNGNPTLVPGTTYYLGITNTGLGQITYTFEVDFNVTPLELNVPFPATAFSNTFQRYFSYDVTPQESAVWFQLTNLNGNVDLVVSKTPFPNTVSNSYASFNPGTFDESIVIFTNSEPVLLTPGRWYLGVFNRDTTTNVDYTILVTDMTNAIPPIVILKNAVPYQNTNTVTAFGTNDYYLFNVSTNSIRAQFELYNMSTNMALAVRRGLPLPDGTSNDYYNDLPGTNDESLILLTNSTPVRLEPGPWFLTAINLSPGPATYTIRATEFTVNPGIIITNEFVFSNQFCITWTSLPGLTYFVEGKTDLLSTNWTTIASNVLSVAYSTTYCVPITANYQFFRVGLGIPPASSAAPSALRISSINWTGSGVQLTWTNTPNVTNFVQYSPGISPTNWAEIPTPITSTNSAYSFFDNGILSGGFGTAKFYRLRQ